MKRCVGVAILPEWIAVNDIDHSGSILSRVLAASKLETQVLLKYLQVNDRSVPQSKQEPERDFAILLRSDYVRLREGEQIVSELEIVIPSNCLLTNNGSVSKPKRKARDDVLILLQPDHVRVGELEEVVVHLRSDLVRLGEDEVADLIVDEVKVVLLRSDHVRVGEDELFVLTGHEIQVFKLESLTGGEVGDVEVERHHRTHRGIDLGDLPYLAFGVSQCDGETSL